MLQALVVVVVLFGTRFGADTVPEYGHEGRRPSGPGPGYGDDPIGYGHRGQVGMIRPAGLDRSELKEQIGTGLAAKRVRNWWCLINNERDANMMSLLQMARMTQTSRHPTQLDLTHLTSPLVSPMPTLF